MSWTYHRCLISYNTYCFVLFIYKTTGCQSCLFLQIFRCQSCLFYKFSSVSHVYLIIVNIHGKCHFHNINFKCKVERVVSRRSSRFTFPLQPWYNVCSFPSWKITQLLAIVFFFRSYFVLVINLLQYRLLIFSDYCYRKHDIVHTSQL